MGEMLAGVTVLELGQVIAGTYAGLLLADMGAEVIKIEPLTGDANRNPGIAPLGGESTIHLFMNRNKKSVALNLKDPEGLELFYRLVEQADVVIDNFRPGVMARLGIDHEKLKQRNPGIVTSSVTGFGEYGPAKDRPAFDLVIQAIAGHLHITGDPDGAPARVGVPLADLAGGLFACISVLGSLCGRLLHGTGSHSDVGMLDSLVSMLGYDGLDYLNSGRPVTRHGTAHAHLVPWQAFQVADGYIVVAAREDKFWRRLADAIGEPDLKDDSRTATNNARLANREFVTAVLEKHFATRTKREWVELLARFDIPAAPVNDLEEVFADPQVQARGLVRSYRHPALGDVRYPASPMQFDSWVFPNAAAPDLGEHSATVLRTRLGIDDKVLADLADRKVVGLADRLSVR
jgi:crotonobetainyl-CoA:carnitine CoA-transferase CaiB-like acyl-CoA transferase